MARCISKLHHLILQHLNILEENNELNIDDDVHLFCLHYIFLPKINMSIRAFKDGWNEHPMQSERGLSPSQLWLQGMAWYREQVQDSLCVSFEAKSYLTIIYTIIFTTRTLTQTCMELTGMHHCPLMMMSILLGSQPLLPPFPLLIMLSYVRQSIR